MTHNQEKFNAATIGEKFESAYERFNELLTQSPHEKLIEIQNNFHEQLKSYRADGVLSVAFIGQYSAGKSTIISALTNNRDIKIDADISTDRTTHYVWNGINLVDTPGLFTDRQDHDEITYDVIDKVDLLVFCLTYSLFDDVTVENFKKLAYDKSYRWKMMLIVNKMSAEAGEEDIKIANYRLSLSEAIKPYSLDEFPTCFIDAKDYCEGVDEVDDDLCEDSRFSSFIHELNNFVERRASLVRFDTPVRIALSCLKKAQLEFLEFIYNSDENSAFFEILSQLSRIVRKERDRLRIKVQGIILNTTSAIVKEGIDLANPVGSEQDFKSLNKKTENNVKNHYENAEKELQSVMDTAVKDIAQEVEKILESSLVKTFVACLDKDLNIKDRNLNSRMNVDPIKNQVNWLQGIGETAGSKLTTLATRNFGKTGGPGFLKMLDTSGSPLHKSVRGVGKLVGRKFKPWEAVRVAKNIGNAAKFIGPTIAMVGVVVDGIEIQQERQLDKEIAKIRGEITSEFQSLVKDLENQIHRQFDEFESQIYGRIDKQILLARQQQEETIAASNKWVKELAEIRKEFESIIYQLTQAAEARNQGE